MTVPQTHKWRNEIERTGESDPNKTAKPVIDALYVHRSIRRLAILADKSIRSMEQGRAALAKYGHVLLDRERGVLESFYQVESA